MNRPVTAVGALVRGPSGRWLIVRTTKWRGLWGVPGGKVDYGERLEQAVVREFQEEVGLRLRGVEFAQVQEAVESAEFHKPAHFVLVDFLAESDAEDVVPNEEIEAWAWVTLSEARTYPLNSFTLTLVDHAERTKQSN